jgi:uncharacterized protein (TIGR03437 family)
LSYSHGYSYGGTDCGGFLVTSPASNSVSLIDPSKGNTVRTVKVGPQPYSAGCGAGLAVVSNYGDSSVSVIDLSTFAVTKTIPNVPGSRGYHGVAVFQAYANGTAGPPQAWVAGTDADAVTVVDLNQLKTVVTFPVRKPTALSADFLVASAGDNAILAMDPAKLQVASTYKNVPTPQDVTNSWIGILASTGANNSVVDAWSPASRSVAIPGAAAVAAIPYDISLNYPPYWALATSPDSNSVYFVQFAPPPPAVPNQVAIANAASFGQAAPGSLASVFASTGVSQNFYAGSLPIPTALGGVSLSIGGSLNYDAASAKWTYSSTGSVKAPLFFVGPNQINLQVPPGVALGTPVPLQLTKPDGSTLLSTATFAASAPGIFTLAMNGQGQAAALNQDNSVNFGTNPAKRGSVIQIFATGGGDTAPALGAGEAAPASGNPLVLTKVQPTVTIGGKNATVQFSGMAPGFVGLWQINAQVPADVTPGNAVPLVVTAAGVASNTVTIAVQ